MVLPLETVNGLKGRWGYYYINRLTIGQDVPIFWAVVICSMCSNGLPFRAGCLLRVDYEVLTFNDKQEVTSQVYE